MSDMDARPFASPAASAGDSVAALMNDLQWIYLVILLSVVLDVAICYDHILTLDREIRYIWKGRFSISIFLFYSMRYCALLGAVRIFWNAIVSTTTVRAPSSTDSTFRLIPVAISSSVGVVISLAAAVFAGLRAYAISERNKWVLAIVLALGFVMPAIQIVNMIRGYRLYVDENRRYGDANIPASGTLVTHAEFCLSSSLGVWGFGLTCVFNSRFILDLQEANACLNSATGLGAGTGATSLEFAASPGSEPPSLGGQSSHVASTERVERGGAQIAEV
ncbi:hypothetical protein VTO73DRAFT_10946 [Trametes versicolor]